MFYKPDFCWLYDVALFWLVASHANGAKRSHRVTDWLASWVGWLPDMGRFVDSWLCSGECFTVLHQYQKYVFPCLLWVVSKIIQVPSPCMLEVPISNRPCNGANLTHFFDLPRFAKRCLGCVPRCEASTNRQLSIVAFNLIQPWP